MKFKFLQAEFEFDKDDASIAVPLVLLALALAFTPIPKLWLLIGAGVYYVLLLFLLEPVRKLIERERKKRQCRCPYCKSLSTVVLGLGDYLGDVPYYFYRCNDCGRESVFIDDKLCEPVAYKKKLTQ